MTPSDAARHFSQSYQEARAKFLAATDAAGLDAFAHPHPMLGRDGEVLAMDVVREGPANARALLIVSSGCHGVEGFCGSGVQTALLHDAAWHRAVAEAGVAVLYIHALNPYGFSWWRRTTHENVDLNRNFHDFSQPLPRNDAYDELAAAIVPASWPPPDEANAAMQRYAQQHGVAGLQAAVSRGQYNHPQGVFYGGRDPTWSHVTLRHVLQEHATRCARLGWIDLHTGLGPAGVGERIFACRDDAAALQRARAWWGDQVTSIYDGSSTSARLQGLMWLAADEECAQAEYTGIALEYGTLPIMAMLDALRADQWIENHPEAPDTLRAQIKRQTRDAFYIDTDDWKRQVIEQAFDAAHAAVRGLAAR
ncbi:MAG: M14 family metallopeptidase [Burkholderiales bacterium]|nr:M14 family metallopeptidase [Burkholderiales bacterium]